MNLVKTSQLITELVEISRREGSFEECFSNILTLLVRKTNSECGCIFAEFENTDKILSREDENTRVFFDHWFDLYLESRQRQGDLATRPHISVRELYSLSNRSSGQPEESGMIYPLYDGEKVCGAICLCGSGQTKRSSPSVILGDASVKLIAEIYVARKLALINKHYAVEAAISEIVNKEGSFHRLASIILSSLGLYAVILLMHDANLSCADVIMADSCLPTTFKKMIKDLHLDLRSNSLMRATFNSRKRGTVFKPEQILNMLAGSQEEGPTPEVANGIAELQIGELLLSPSGYRQNGRMLFLVAVKKASRAFMKSETRCFQQLSRLVSLALEKRTSDQIYSKKVSSTESVQRISRRIIDDSDINIEAKFIQQELELHSCAILQLDRLENVLRVEGFSSKINRPDFRMEPFSISLEALYSSGYSQSDLHNFSISKLSEYGDLIVERLGVEREKLLSLILEYRNHSVIRIPLFDSYRRLQGILLLLREPGQEIQSSETDIIRDFGSKIASAFEIRQNIYFDSLTGLPNIKRLRPILVDRSISAQPFSLMVCKIVNLDDIVISRGDEVADKCIVTVARRIKMLIEGNKRHIEVFRTSGEASFMVLFPSVDSSEVADFSQRLIGSIAMPMEVDENVVGLQTNIGVCPSTGIWETDMIINYGKLAIQTISGRHNVFCVFDAGMQMNYRNEKDLEEDIRKSLSARDFIPHYQPKVLCDGSIAGYEALARWKRGSKLEGPGVFINKVERMGMMQNLFNIVFSNVCKDLSKSERLRAVSINISPSQLGEAKGLLHSVSLTVSQYLIDPGRITFEFVETALLDSDYYNTVKELKGMGFRVSLDDFGTGYARYKTLVDLFNQQIVNEIKIDKVFIDDIELHANQSFMRSISYLAEEFGIAVVAEGVETMNQLARIRSLSPKVIVQGWLVAKALPRAEVETFDEGRVVSMFQASGT